MSNGTSFSNVVDCCGKHTRGQLDPHDRQSVIAQLHVEGHKRLEAFLFEPDVTRAVAACCGVEQTTTGWSFQLDGQDRPQYWFKLLHKPEQKSNACDQRMAKFLIGAGCDVIVSKYDASTRSFKSSTYLRTERKWSVETTLVEALNHLLGTSGPKAFPKNYTTINPEHQDLAIHRIDQIFSDDELYNLSVSRLLVNCFLFPWFQKQPMDIDVCCVVNGQLRMIEFKRKYPTRSGTFGIDMHPHGILIDWLSNHQQSLTHLVLCDPLWDKNISATHLLEPESSTASSAYWLAAELNTQNTQAGTHRTSGTDSGFTGGERTQRALPLCLFNLVGKGLQPQFLGEYLSHGSLTVTEAMLTQARDTARNRRGLPCNLA